MNQKIKQHKGKISIGAVLIAFLANFGTISNELQEWWYMAKGEDTKPASDKNRSEAFLHDNQDYEIVNSTLQKQKPKTKK